MLAKVNRLSKGSDYKNVVRHGERIGGRNTVTYVLRKGEGHPRFGFIVAKTVGNAVNRNLVRRRLKASCFELVPLAAGSDVVIRALPAAAGVPWRVLHDEVSGAVNRGIR